MVRRKYRFEFDLFPVSDLGRELAEYANTSCNSQYCHSFISFPLAVQTEVVGEFL